MPCQTISSTLNPAHAILGHVHAPTLLANDRRSLRPCCERGGAESGAASVHDGSQALADRNGQPRFCGRMRRDAILYKTKDSRGGNRTRTPLSEPRILSPVRLPISPLGRIVFAEKVSKNCDGRTVAELVRVPNRSLTTYATNHHDIRTSTALSWCSISRSAIPESGHQHRLLAWEARPRRTNG